MPESQSNRAVSRDTLRPEVASDAISGVVVDRKGTDVHVKIGDSRSNRS